MAISRKFISNVFLVFIGIGCIVMFNKFMRVSSGGALYQGDAHRLWLSDFLSFQQSREHSISSNAYDDEESEVDSKCVLEVPDSTEARENLDGDLELVFPNGTITTRQRCVS